MEIGEKIRNARRKAGLTQEEAAEKILVSRQTISNWEKGKTLPDISSVLTMSELYAVSLDELLKGDPTMKEKIERDEKSRKTTQKWLNLVTVVIVLAAILEMLCIRFHNPVMDFIGAALPWVLMGLGVAIVCAKLPQKSIEIVNSSTGRSK